MTTEQLASDEAQKIADEYAEEIALNATEINYGTWRIPRLGKLLIFSNYPYSKPALRPKEFDRIERRLSKEHGIKTLARGLGGKCMDESQEYTMTLLLDCTDDDDDLEYEVYCILREEHQRTLRSIPTQRS